MSNFSFTKIDVPAAAGTYVYISADGVDAAGEAVGNYGNVDGEGDGTFDGFVTDGPVGTTYDPPGSTNTDVVGITSSGEIFGDYVDNINRQHGFVDKAGVVTKIDVVLANSTTVSGVNDAGVIYGEFADNTNRVHGFLDNNGTNTPIDVPGASSTSVTGVNASGQIAGTFTDAEDVVHGFVDSNGSFTTIDPAGSIFTSIVGISDAGVVVGNYQDSANNLHGFVVANGVTTTINIPGATSVSVQAINAAGDIVGYYADGSGNVHGFVDEGGVVTKVDVPGATETDILGVSATGEITGYFNDANGQHGFVGAPVPTVIESSGSTSLVEVGNEYFLNPVAGRNGPELMFSGAPVTDGMWSGWTPVGAEQTAGGYDVAFENASTGLFNIWSVDSNGNYITNLASGVSGTSAALENFETIFHQDLNGDGAIGAPTAVIESSGSTSLAQLANAYFLNPVAGGGGTELMFSGAPVTAGMWSGWAPVGAEQTAGGYDVAFENSSTGLFNIWSTDSNGNYITNLASGVSGTSAALENFEAIFHQDLNGDGTIGAPAVVIESSGSTSLAEVANDYFLNPVAGGSGPELIFFGAPVTAGMWSGWAPVGAEQTAGGYDVAFENSSTGLFNIWSTDSNGNYITNLASGVSGTSAALENFEAIFHQDLNGDGVIDTASTVIEATGGIVLTLSHTTQAASIAAGARLELTSADSASVTFNGATGSLILDHSSLFSAQVFNFTGDGNPSSSDQIDLKDITFAAGTTVSYAGTSSGGTLTVSDAENHTAHISLAGYYTSSTFSLSSDGSGGTDVIDPAAKQDVADGTLSFDETASTDQQTVSVSPQNGGVGYLGNFAVDAANAVDGQDSVGWHFNFDSSPPAKTITQSYDVAVTDHHADGTHSSATQLVSVTIAGPGNDSFVFHPGGGSETIVNAGSADTFELDGFSSVTNSNQLAQLLSEAQAGQPQSLFTAANGGHDTVIHLADHDSVTLMNVELANLHVSNFIIH